MRRAIRRMAQRIGGNIARTKHCPVDRYLHQPLLNVYRIKFNAQITLEKSRPKFYHLVIISEYFSTEKVIFLLCIEN